MTSFKLQVSLVLMMALSVAANGAEPLKYRQMLMSIAPPHGGASVMTTVASTFNKMATTINYPPELSAAFDDIVDHAVKFQFDELHRKGLAVSSPEGFKALYFQGTHRKSDYWFSLSKQAVAPGDLKEMGDLLFSIQVKKNEKTIIPNEQSFSVKIDNVLNSKEFSHKVAAQFLTGLLKIADPDNIKKLSLKDQEFASDFPKTSAFISKFARTITIKNEPKEFDGQVYSDISYRLLLDMEKLDEAYPDLTDYLEDLLMKMDMKVSFLTSKGHRLFTLHHGNKGEASVEFELVTKNGKLIPVGTEGKPVFEEAIGLGDLDSYYFLGEVVGAMKWTGLTIDFSMRMNIEYSADEGKVLFSGTLNALPLLNIDGWLFYFIPIFNWKLDPASFAPDTMKVLLHGNGGRGLTYTLTGATSGSNESWWRVQSTMEILDSFLVSYLTKPIMDKFPDDDERADIARFVAKLTSNLTVDLQALQQPLHNRDDH